MVKDTLRYSQPNEMKTIRKQDGDELVTGEVQKLRDAAWAGLAHMMQENMSIVCKQSGHEWITDSDGRIFCKRCGIEKEADE